MADHPSVLLIHPIGVGLSCRFWDRFIQAWHKQQGAATDDLASDLQAPDLLGCGDAPQPARPLGPEDWAAPLITQLRQGAQGSIVLVSQGSSLPIALKILEAVPDRVAGLIAISPPGWRVLSEPFDQSRAHQLWRVLFSGPLGTLFYLWARRRAFLKSFSEKNLFARPEDVDAEWLETLERGSRPLSSRWAVFSFLAGFWRQNWEPILMDLSIPVLVVHGTTATGIGRSKRWDDADERVATYAEKMPSATIRLVEGRNVLPYESSHDCVRCVREWFEAQSWSASAPSEPLTAAESHDVD